MIGKADILKALDSLGLADSILCVHGSLKSFGPVEGGAATLIDALADKGGTVVVPTFYYQSIVRPPEGIRIRQNGLDAQSFAIPGNPWLVPYNPADPTHIDSSMGIIPATLLARPDRVRGDHPLNSFCAIGPKATELMAAQTPMNAYGPYRLINQDENARIILMGVGLNRCTPIHYGEVLAGRRLFHSWAQYADGRIVETRVGSCSDGFPRLDPHVRDIESRIVVGDSIWRIFRFHEFVHRIANVVKAQPDITHCANPDCTRCHDMLAGGPLVD